VSAGQAGVDAVRPVVAIGGGHGLARTLRALVALDGGAAAGDRPLTAVVTVADDGGSSGRLRRDLGVLPLGDLRMAVLALAPPGDLGTLVDFRFTRGELAGHSLGNLMLVALHEASDGETVRALDRLVALVGGRGRVLPCTTERVTLRARAHGTPIAGQAAIAATSGLERVWLEPPQPVATPAAVQAIERASMVVVGPGSLYTSLLPNLLVPGIGAALVRTAAQVVFVANLRQQSGETEGMTLADHLAALQAHVPGVRFDVIVANATADPGDPRALMAGDLGAEWRARMVVRRLHDEGGAHDPAALAAVLGELLER